MDTNNSIFTIQRKKVARYFFWLHFLISFCMWGVGWIFYLLLFSWWLPRSQSQVLEYWIEGNSVRINEGVVFRRQKTIPLDRITDVVIMQGPLLRACGIRAIHIQTGGTGQPMPEGKVLGVVDPEAVRDAIIEARDRMLGTAKLIG